MRSYGYVTKGMLAISLLAGSIAEAVVVQDPVPYPEPQALDQRGEVSFIGYDDFQTFGTKDSYGEPAFMTELVKQGKLPPVAARLPKEPYIFKTDAMADGIGEYGGVFRMVTGGRPQGWNWMAGQAQGYGGVNYTVQECLTRTGPMFQVKAEELEPLPNLARSWEWSEDGHQLTMNLIEGGKWSDGNDFDADDIIFMWEDNIVDPNVPAPLNKDSLGKGTKLEKLDKYTVQWTFPTSFPKQYLHNMAAFQMCPGPSHVLKPEHPKYNPEATYNSYMNALGPDRLPWVSMGAWTAVEYKADEMIVMRRNPYYWKIDEAGNQLPYMNELQFKLSTWTDRTTQTLAGNADVSNMENPPVYVESLRQASRPDSPARLDFGPRTVGFEIHLNLAKAFGASSERDLAIRDLNRDPRFRRALSHALDRQAMGQSLVRGPFAHVYAGGTLPETSYFNKDSVVYYPYSPDSAKALFGEMGLKDRNGDGYKQWTVGPMADKTVELVLGIDNERPSDAILADNIVAMFKEAGLKIITQPLRATAMHTMTNSGNYDMVISRTERENVTPDTQYQFLAPMNLRSVRWHRGSSEYPLELLDFEEKLVSIVTALQATHDSVKKVELINEYNRIYTKNNYAIGLVAAPGALILNKRIKNASAGTPVLAYQWADGALVRERLWVPAEKQLNEIFPGVLPNIN